MKNTLQLAATLALANLLVSASGAEVSIPDPGLNAAIRDALLKPVGPLTETDLLGLTNLSARNRSVSSIEGLEAALNLVSLDLGTNLLTNVSLPGQLTNLMILNVSANPLTNFFLPGGLTRLTSLTLESDGLTDLTLPAGLGNLTGLFVTGNQLTTLTLPPDMTRLTNFGFLGNPLTTFVLAEPLAATNLAADVALLQNQGVSIFTYPLTVQLLRPRPLTGAFQFGITGPPGVYALLASADLADWSEVGIASNTLGSISFVDATSHNAPRRFYRALRQDPPANMVFIPPNTFIMGGPTNELHRQSNEGP